MAFGAGALVIGAVAGFACLWGVNGLKKLMGADDSLDVFGVHGVGGIVGMILTGVFAQGSGLIHGNEKLFFLDLGATVLVDEGAITVPACSSTGRTSATHSWSRSGMPGRSNARGCTNWRSCSVTT